MAPESDYGQDMPALPHRRGRRAPAEGSRAATIRDVAAAAGVSRATASRVLSGNTPVSPATRAAVENAIAQLGFVPSSAARSLALGRSGTVALVLPEPNLRVLSDPFFQSVILGATEALEGADLQTVLLLARTNQRTDRIVDYLAGRHVDGAVIASHHQHDALNQAVLDLGLPAVFIGRPLDVTGATYVDNDNRLGGWIATTRLIERGCRNIATITGPRDMTAGVDRLDGFRDALVQHGLSAAAVAAGDFTDIGGRAAMAELLEAGRPVDGVFAASDLMALGALRELGARGYRVPDDIAVVGFDDITAAEHTDPPLTTISHAVEAMANKAGQLLLDVLAGRDDGAAPVIFTPHLVARESA